MTFSNGVFSPHPLANPLNSRLGPSNYTFNQFGQSFRSRSVTIKSNVDLPDPIMLNDMQAQSDRRCLEVPNQLDYAQTGPNLDIVALKTQYKNSYVDSNGTVYDLDSGKIVFQHELPRNANEWGPCKSITRFDTTAEWRNSDIYKLDTQPNALNIDKTSQAYWQSVQKQANTEMNDLQKELLADLDSGAFVGKSRLEDC